MKEELKPMTWDILYKELTRLNTPEVDYKTFYRDIFQPNTLEREGIENDNKPNGMMTYIKSIEVQEGSEEKTIRKSATQLFFDDLHGLFDAIEDPSLDALYVPALTYFGRRRTWNNASTLNAMVFDLDGVGEGELYDIFHQMKHTIFPEPTYMVLSGHGLHLYYVFEEPIPLYRSNRDFLQKVKRQLTDVIWNSYTSTEKRQHQPVNQAFNAVGRPTKDGKHKVVAFETGSKVTLKYLFDFISDINWRDMYGVSKEFQKERLDFKTAKSLYPEWAERVETYNKKKSRLLALIQTAKKYGKTSLVKRRKTELRKLQEEYEKSKRRYGWTTKPELYYWWIEKLKTGTYDGNRYYCIFALAIYAIKAGISEEQLKKDAYGLVPYLDAKTEKSHNHFTDRDVDAALRGYAEAYRLFPRDTISNLTKIEIPANKRNGRKQDKHIRIMNAIRDIEHPDGEWRNKDGAPTKQFEVVNYFKGNPNASISQAARDLNMSRNTIAKWKPKD